MVWIVLLAREVFLFVFCVSDVCKCVLFQFLIAVDCLKRLLSEMTYNVSSETLNPSAGVGGPPNTNVRPLFTDRRVREFFHRL